MDEDTTIDEGLFNRQLYVIDRESMQHMRRSRVLIYGLDALGVETGESLCNTGKKTRAPTACTDPCVPSYVSLLTILTDVPCPARLQPRTCVSWV